MNIRIERNVRSRRCLTEKVEITEKVTAVKVTACEYGKEKPCGDPVSYEAWLHGDPYSFQPHLWDSKPVMMHLCVVHHDKFAKHRVLLASRRIA